MTSRVVEPGTCPAHLSSYRFGSFEEMLGQLAETVEGERQRVWRKAYLCAAARYQFGDDQRLTGKLAETLSCSGQQVRRYCALGDTFPENITDPKTGEITALVDYTRPVNLYLEALKADDPVMAIQQALDHDWSVKQLREHLNGVERPASSLELLDVEIQDPDIEQVITFVTDALLTAHQVRRSYGRLSSVRIRVTGQYEGV